MTADDPRPAGEACECEHDRGAAALWESERGTVSYEWAEISEAARSNWLRLARVALLAMTAERDEQVEIVVAALVARAELAEAAVRRVREVANRSLTTPYRDAIRRALDDR